MCNTVKIANDFIYCRMSDMRKPDITHTAHDIQLETGCLSQIFLSNRHLIEYYPVYGESPPIILDTHELKKKTQGVSTVLGTFHW